MTASRKAAALAAVAALTLTGCQPGQDSCQPHHASIVAPVAALVTVLAKGGGGGGHASSGGHSSTGGRGSSRAGRGTTARPFVGGAHGHGCSNGQPR